MKITDFKDERAPLIKRYQGNFTPSGYDFVMIINDEAEACYEEECDYENFEDAELLPPFEGSSYKLRCAPGECQVVLLNLQPD